MTAALCALCDRVLPLGGVLDHRGRQVHDWCRGVELQRVAEDARATARKVAKGGKPRQKPRVNLEGVPA